jgi:protein tyrosine/serine phosphatase
MSEDFIKRTHVPSGIPLYKTIVLFLLLSGLCQAQEVSPRPARWATKVEIPGVQNLFKITDYLYRSQQPSETGVRELKQRLGIKTVINLRAFHSDKTMVKNQGLLNEELSVKTWHIEDEDVVKVLSLLRKKENGPFLLHCQHGADRTGVMSAMFRIVEQGWTKEEAIDEMVLGGYGFHPIWTNIITYINHVDVKKILAAVNKIAPSDNSLKQTPGSKAD